MDPYDIYIEDEKGKPLLVINKNGEIAASRFPNMSTELKNKVIELYSEVTGESEDRIRSFLNYTSEDNEFCS